jgi:hypothetical protein
MTVPLKFNPSTQPGERVTGSARTCCDGSLGPAREGSFHFVTRPLRWKRDRSLASTPGSAELTSATTIRSTRRALEHAQLGDRGRYARIAEDRHARDAGGDFL